MYQALLEIKEDMGECREEGGVEQGHSFKGKSSIQIFKRRLFEIGMMSPDMKFHHFAAS